MLSKERVQEIYDKALDRSPMFYGDVHYEVTKGRQKIKGVADKIVMKGTYTEILSNKSVKRRALTHYFGENKEAQKKAWNFDINKVRLIRVVFKKHLGYGIKEN